MAFNISPFKANIAKHGVARPAHFAVNITPPSSLSDSIVKDLPLLVDSANAPGVTFMVNPVFHKGYGLEEQRAINASFDAFTITVVGDSNGRVMAFFEKWASLVMNFNGESDEDSNGIPSEMLNYPEEYWGTIELYMYDVTSKQYQWYQMSKAFPLNVGQVQLGWGMVDELVRIPITFTFRSLKTKTTDSLSSSSSSINTMTQSSSRNIAKLENLLLRPDADAYQQRLLTI